MKQGTILNFLPLDDGQHRSVNAILNLSGKMIDNPSVGGGTLVEIADYASRTIGDDVVYKIVNNRTNEIKMDRSGPPWFYRVVVVEGKDKGKQGWVEAGMVNIKTNNLAELDQIKKDCMMLMGQDEKPDQSKLENKASLFLNGKEILFDIFRGGDNANTDAGPNPRINLPDKGGVDRIAGYPDTITRGANEIGNIILDGLDGSLDGKCMSPDGRRISQLEAEALSDNFSYEMARFHREPDKYKYPFSAYLPKDPQKKQAILDVCPDQRLLRFGNGPDFQSQMNYYDRRSKILMQANDLVKLGKNMEAYDLLKKKGYNAYACKVPASAEFFAKIPSATTGK